MLFSSGAILDRFQVKARLARGGMGELWLAADGAGTDVVLKTVRQDLCDDDEIMRSFEREIRVTAQLDHAHVVRHVAHGHWQGRGVLALAHIHGRSLAELVDRARLPLGAALCVVKDIADALAYVHRLEAADGAPLGVVHGDVSPQNILVDADGDAHLIDFGAVKLADDPVGEDIIGKPGYLSPEQSRADVIDARSDQYSLGIVLWELLAGRDLFDGSAARRGRAIPSLAALVQAPPAVDDVVLRMLGYACEDRYATTADVAAVLARLAPKPETKSRAWLAQAIRRPRPRPRPRRRERAAARRATQKTAPQQAIRHQRQAGEGGGGDARDARSDLQAAAQRHGAGEVRGDVPGASRGRAR